MMPPRKFKADTTPGNNHLGAMPKNSADLAVTYMDPLDPDLPSDAALTLSHRQLGRLMFIAADTGARFERESVAIDPVAWLFAPRDLFHGCQAVEACQQREPFVRAILLHGLSIGLDADPGEIESMIDKNRTAEPGPLERQLPWDFRRTFAELPG